MLKIKLVNYSYVYGGQEKYLDILYEILTYKGFSVDIEGSPCKLLENKDHNNNYYYDLTILNGNSSLYHYMFKCLNNSYVVYIQHSDINDSQGPVWKRYIRKFLLKVLLLRVDFVVRVCDKCLPEFYAPNKITTIYNGVSFPNVIKRQEKDTPLKLLMVGAVNKNKNQSLAIDCLTRLKNAELTIVGDGPDLEKLKLKAKQLNVDHRIKFVGFSDDPSSYYLNHDLLLMLSENEAFPLVVLEAMARSCPVLSVPVGGVPEVITHRDNGWICQNYEVENLVNMINEINSDNFNYNQISINARETIRHRFTDKLMVKTLINLISDKVKK
ncbi:glycosyltransferase [Photobacterium damselae]|uniref:glycosyltransferase n=1 Tax=Photobacterium damselae TaxID=38293 RepID=UPI0025430785